ncbi:hypothetical protein L873DRAFT_872048 [Choiromyces venosus 120613-1]|uniref:Uncharacterized protein n=1 Tax=Choiromyces venosus 120613-1 TaxID=1336337 RepID=A0A3N4JN63_9PEZI|nr:hypothetical protein L873DRAFT_872048 [Choiromyces venosus 120613-1]
MNVARSLEVGRAIRTWVFFSCAIYFYRRHRFWFFFLRFIGKKKGDPSTLRYPSSVSTIILFCFHGTTFCFFKYKLCIFTTFYCSWSPCLIPAPPTNLYTINSLSPIEVNILYLAAELGQFFYFYFFAFPFTHLEADRSLLGWESVHVAWNVLCVS